MLGLSPLFFKYYKQTKYNFGGAPTGGGGATRGRGHGPSGPLNPALNALNTQGIIWQEKMQTAETVSGQ